MKSWTEIYQKKYGNEALLNIRAANLNAADFSRELGNDGMKITFLPTGNSFFFGGTDATGWYASPGYGKITQIPSGWDVQFNYYRNWVESVQKFVAAADEQAKAPDLWSAIHTEQTFVQQMRATGLENQPFTLDERRYIATQLRELKAFIIAADVAQHSQAEEVANRFLYLEEAAARMGRKDWLNILFATLVTIVVSGVFAPERANELFAMAAALFQALYGFIAQLPSA